MGRWDITRCSRWSIFTQKIERTNIYQQWHTTQHDTTRHDKTWHDTTRLDTTRRDTTGHVTSQHDTTRHDKHCLKLIQNYDTVQCSIVVFKARHMINVWNWYTYSVVYSVHYSTKQYVVDGKLYQSCREFVTNDLVTVVTKASVDSSYIGGGIKDKDKAVWDSGRPTNSGDVHTTGTVNVDRSHKYNNLSQYKPPTLLLSVWMVWFPSSI